MPRSNFPLKFPFSFFSPAQVSFLEPLNLQQPLSAAVPNNCSSLGPSVVGIGTGALPHQPQPSLQQQQQQQPQQQFVLAPPTSVVNPLELEEELIDGVRETATLGPATVAIKTVEEVFDTRRSYKRSTGRSQPRPHRRRSSNSEVKYINQNFSSGELWGCWVVYGTTKLWFDFRIFRAHFFRRRGKQRRR